MDIEKSKLIELCERVLPLPTYSYYEFRVRDEIMKIAEENNWPFFVDDVGNVYTSNVVDDTLHGHPCLVAHMDTVHDDHMEHIFKNLHLTLTYDEEDDGTRIGAKDPLTNDVTGVGGDDKAGIVIALYFLLNSNKPLNATFFISEENGCRGSSLIGRSNLLEAVPYFIEFDAPTNYWISERCSGIHLFGQEFKNDIMPILERHDLYNDCFSDDPFTDVKELRKRFSVPCLNLFAGYYDMHSDQETVNVDHMMESMELAEDLLSSLDAEKYKLGLVDKGS